MIEQDRALHAADSVQKVGDKKIREYSQLVNKLPAMLTGVGLGQTVAFLLSKQKQEDGPDGQQGARNKTVEGMLYEHLNAWLVKEAPVGWPADAGDKLEDLMARCGNAVYYQALGEAIQYAGWLKRLARARAQSSEESHGKGQT